MIVISPEEGATNVTARRKPTDMRSKKSFLIESVPFPPARRLAPRGRELTRWLTPAGYRNVALSGLDFLTLRIIKTHLYVPPNFERTPKNERALASPLALK